MTDEKRFLISIPQESHFLGSFGVQCVSLLQVWFVGKPARPLGSRYENGLVRRHDRPLPPVPDRHPLDWSQAVPDPSSRPNSEEEPVFRVCDSSVNSPANSAEEPKE
jgi:hypothetical protein